MLSCVFIKYVQCSSLLDLRRNSVTCRAPSLTNWALLLLSLFHCSQASASVSMMMMISTTKMQWCSAFTCPCAWASEIVIWSEGLSVNACASNRTTHTQTTTLFHRAHTLCVAEVFFYLYKGFFVWSGKMLWCVIRLDMAFAFFFFSLLVFLLLLISSETSAVFASYYFLFFNCNSRLIALQRT